MQRVLALILLLSLSLVANAQVNLMVSLSPAGSFQASSKKVKGNLLKHGEVFTADKISVSIESFKTGMDLRDEHFWKHLNSNKHPKATLSHLKGQGGKANGILEVNGVKKPVTIDYKVLGPNVVAKFAVNASDFSLSKAEYLGVGVNDKVIVEATLPYIAK